MTGFGPDSLRIDEAAETERIADEIRTYMRRVRRKGAVVAVSGGIDSSVVAALCVHALGPKEGGRQQRDQKGEAVAHGCRRMPREP